MDTFGNWLRLSAKSLLSKTEKNSDIWANSDNLSPVKPLHSRRESECVTNLRDETQISTQTSRSWLRFSSEYLSNNLMDGGQRPHPARKFWVYSDFMSFSSLYSRLLADFLSHLGKWVKLIKFEAENEFFCTWKVEKPQSTTSTP